LRGVSINKTFHHLTLIFVNQENVLLDSDFHCRIANFGLAQASDFNFSPQSTTTLDSSDPSPEQSGTVDERPRDVHAFGCLYYEVRALKSAARLTVTVSGIFRCYAFLSAKRTRN
jgi:hypothetical protein